MSADQNTIAQKLLAHIHHLAEEIGPRGSTQPEEAQAAEYSAAFFQSQDYTPKIDTFQSATSIYHPHILASLLMLLAFILYPLQNRLTAALAAGLSLLALVSDLLELGFINNPFRWIVPKGQSQNIIATLAPEGDHRQDLILMGHLDTHQAGLIFSSPGWVTFFQTFTTLAFAAFSAQTTFYLIGILAQWDWLWFATMPSALAAVILLAICIQADRSAYSPGANDNASAAAMVLTLAETLKQSPLSHTRVWFVCTGCEEVQHYGAIDFLKRHQPDFVNPKALVFEMLGVAGPAWETREGIIVPFKPDPNLVKIVEDIAEKHPELGAYPSQITGGNSEMADAVRFGIPAITFFGLTPEGKAPYWHQMGDTVDKINPDVLSRTYAFTKLFIQRLDDQARNADQAP